MGKKLSVLLLALWEWLSSHWIFFVFSCSIFRHGQVQYFIQLVFATGEASRRKYQEHIEGLPHGKAGNVDFR